MLKLIRQERIYLLMLIFIVLFNLAIQPGNKEISTLGSNSLTQKIKAEELSKVVAENKSLKEKLSVISFFFTLILISGIVLLMRFCYLKLQGKEIINRFSEVPIRINWEIGDIARVIILLLFFAYFIHIFLYLLFRLFLVNLHSNLRSIISTGIVDLLALFFVFYFVLKKYKQKITSLGINFKHFFKKIKLGVAIYIAIIPILVLLVVFLGTLVQRLNYQPPVHPLANIILGEKNILFLIFLFLLGAIIGPIIEEIFFRGFAYPALKKKTGIFFSIIITATFFAALHQNLFAFLPIFFLGVVLAYVYEKSDSLIPSMTIHILHNSLMITGMFLMKKNLF